MNVILTKVSFKKSSISLPSPASCKSIKSDDGGLISTIILSIVERDVALEPIIWFIASLMALKCISPSSPSRLVPSPPIIRSVITLTSCSDNTSTLLPLSPLVYEILIKTQGFSYSLTISFQQARLTTGVEISTFLLTSEKSVVAAVPILILATSPIVSIS